jgi:hypothetical protein
VKKFTPRHLAIILGCYPEVANQAKQTTRNTKTMKTIIIGIVAMLGVTGALHAQKGERKGGDGQLLDKLDTDGDGMVSKQEWLNGPAKKMPEARANARFSMLDKDGNGALDEKEWEAVRTGKGNRNRVQQGAKGRKGQDARGARDGRKAGPGKGKGRPGAGGAGRGAGGGKRGVR